MYGAGGGGRTVRVGGGDGGTFDAKYFKCIEALHRNEGWPAPPSVTSERRLEGLPNFIGPLKLWPMVYI